MKREDPLFSLIRSLTQHEKRYFRLHSGMRGGNNSSQLWQLFQLLASHHRYDEAAIRRNLGTSPLGRQFAVYKNLLYHALLRSLQAYRYENTPAMQVRSGIDKVEILSEKGKQDAALKMLKRTFNIAETYALYNYHLEMLAWERRLLRHLHPTRFLDLLPPIEAAERRATLILRQDQEAAGIYDHLFARLQVDRRTEKSRAAAQIAAMGDRLSALAGSVYPAFNTRATLFNAMALFRQIQGDYAGMMKEYAGLLKLWDTHPRIRESDPQRYARVQIAWLNSTLAAGQVGAHLPVIRSLRRLPIQGQQDRARILFQSYNLELLWLIEQKSTAAASRFLTTFETRIKDMEPFLDEVRLNSFCFNAALLRFREADYSRAIQWIHKIDARGAPDRDTALYQNASILALICHCENGSFEAADSLLHSLGRRLRSHDVDWQFGKLVALWMKKLMPEWGAAGEEKIRADFSQALKIHAAGITPVPMILDVVMEWASRES